MTNREHIQQQMLSAIKSKVSGFQLVNDDDPIQLAGTEPAASFCTSIAEQCMGEFVEWCSANQWRYYKNHTWIREDDGAEETTDNLKKEYLNQNKEK